MLLKRIEHSSIERLAHCHQYEGPVELRRLLDTEGVTENADHQYQYNDASQITQIAEPTTTRNYGYDAVDRLTSATYSNPTQPNENYSYDGVGNRTASQLSASYSYQPFNRLATTSTATFGYDANGNLLSKTTSSGTTQYSWDFENRLSQVTLPNGSSVGYKYDALGRRIQRTPSTGTSTNFIYDGQDVLRDLNSDGSTVDYLNGSGVDNKLRLTDSRLMATGPLYFLADHLGSTTALTNSLGVAVAQITYDAFGNSSGSSLTRYDYTGRERDTDTGLMYYRARWYDPQVGRFLSEDPINFDGGINLYAYVKNSPIKFNDPEGLKVWVCSRLTKAPLSPTGANHSYLFDDRKNLSCGLSGIPPRMHGSTGPENGPFGGDTCRPVDGSDDPGKADQVMNCCKNYRGWTWIPLYSDCHNLAHSCITGAGLKDPGAPGGRLGERCIKCTEPSMKPPDPSKSGKCWGGARGC